LDCKMENKMEKSNDTNPRLRPDGKRRWVRITPKHRERRKTELWEETQKRANEVITPPAISEKKDPIIPDLPLDHGDQMEDILQKEVAQRT